jgi:RimJ/RimL family protein N-acetyltransferase
MSEAAGEAAAPTPLEATLLDGRRIVIRPSGAADEPAITAFFASLSRESLSWRFFSAPRRVNRQLVERLLASGPGRGALLAVPAGRPGPVVAFGSYAYVAAEGSSEISLAVADAWQNVRLGTLLALALVRDALAHGQRRLHAEVLGGNVRMLGLLGEIGAPVRTRYEAGVARVEFEVSA